MIIHRLIPCLLFFCMIAKAHTSEKATTINFKERESSSMKQTIAIYLAGSIQKGNGNSKESFWTESDIHQLQTDLNEFDVVFLNPACRNDALSDPQLLFGGDMLEVFSSHVVFVDARDRRGLGVGAEMMWAKINKIPVVAWAPKNSHYNKGQTTISGTSVTSFIHPFVNALSDQVVETLTQGAEWIKEMALNPASVTIKGIEHVHSAMEYYKATQLQRDDSMKNFVPR